MNADHNVTHHYYDACARPSDPERDKKEYAVVNSMAKIGLLTFGEPCIQGENFPPPNPDFLLLFFFSFLKKRDDADIARIKCHRSKPTKVNNYDAKYAKYACRQRRLHPFIHMIFIHTYSTHAQTSPNAY